jgi:hypothetical protein
MEEGEGEGCRRWRCGDVAGVMWIVVCGGAVTVPGEI